MATLVSVEQVEQSPRAPVEIEVPASTAWPLVLSFGFALMFAGLLTSASVSVLGVVLAVAGCVGWFQEVFPHEHEETVPIVFEERRIATERRVVERVPVAPDLVRAWLPLETYPISAGLKGGLAGGVAMAVLACTYGLVKAGSIWYPINLLAATVYAQSLKLGAAQLNSFHASSFAIALVLHAIGSVFVGLLYGAMLPMFARRHDSGSFNPRAHDEREILASGDTLLPHDDDARYDAEGYLRRHKPNPVNAAGKHRVEKHHDRVQEPGPQHWANQASEHDRTPREHGKHRPIEQSNEDGSDAVQDQCNREAACMKRIQLGGSELERFRIDGSGKQVDGIPDASGLG